MPCELPYEEMMSLKLDGLLDDVDEQLLTLHLRECTDCTAIWTAMQMADTVLCSVASAPLQVPANLQARVMLRIAEVPLYRPSFQGVVGGVGVAVPAFVGGISLATSPVWPAPASTTSVLGNPDVLREWQGRLGQYMRGAAAVVLLMAGTAGLLLGLVMAGIIQISGPVADWIATLRTFFSALGTWVMSVFSDVGGGLVIGMALVMGLMALIAWQMVTTYHRSVTTEGAGSMIEALG